MSYIYLICPVRKCTEEELKQVEDYVAELEKKGHKVHFPHRDCDQDQDGITICRVHAEAMAKADEVHVWWNPTSTGSHFDLGMAFMKMILQLKGEIKDTLKIKVINDYERTPNKSYGNFLYDIQYPNNPLTFQIVGKPD